MRRALPWVLSCLLAAGAGGALLLALRPSRAAAQEAPRFLYISGMKLDRDKPKAIVRLFNTATQPNDVVVLHYTVLGPDAGSAMSLPNAGLTGVPIYPGKWIELDLGKIVTQYRASQGVGTYTGPVQFVATSDGEVGVALTPERIAVDAMQLEGTTRYQANVEWR